MGFEFADEQIARLVPLFPRRLGGQPSAPRSLRGFVRWSPSTSQRGSASGLLQAVALDASDALRTRLTPWYRRPEMMRCLKGLVETVVVPEVRRMGEQNWRTIREVRLRALSQAPEAFGSTFEDEVNRDDEWWISGTRRLAWFVAEDETGPIGLAGGVPPDDAGGWPEVISMWVEPAQRGTGVADELLTSVVSWARGEGAEEVVLWVAEGNERALRFYERAGYVVTGSERPLWSRPSVRTVEMRRSLK